MGKDLVITSIDNDHARKVIARLICQKQAIPLQKALSITAKPPFVFIFNDSDDLLNKVVSQYSKLGIAFRIVDSSKPEAKESSNNLVLPDNTQVVNTTESHRKVELPKTNHPIHHLPSDEVPVTSDKKKKGLSFTSIVPLLIIILIPVILVFLSFKQQKKSFLEDYQGKVTPSNQAETKKTAISKHQPSKQNVTAENKAKSADFTDSAGVYNEDYERAVAFYKLAISFNKYNYRAWYGLVNTYYSMNKLSSAEKAQNEMRKLFGERVFDIGAIIKPFGELETAELRSDSSYFLEYTTETSNRQTLVNETFQIVRAIKPTCNCVSIAIFAQRSAGKGLIVHIKSDQPFFSLTDYKEVATFTFLE